MHLMIVGTGYVGLVSGTCLAEMGHNVICHDIDQEKIDRLNKGEIPIYEPGLAEMVQRNVKAKRLHFTTNYKEAVDQSLVCFLAVPTPSAEDGSADLSYLLDASRRIASVMQEYKIIVNKSTVPVGTAAVVSQHIAQTLSDRGLDLDFDVCSNPEFLKEGNAVQDFLKPDRVVIGADSVQVAAIMKEVYAGFMISRERLLLMDTLSAEMTKYASNAMLATRISFMNELAELCLRTGADIRQIRLGMGTDSRIGYPFLYAGMGYGGSCFPKDVNALSHTARSHGCELSIIDAVERVNQKQKHVVSSQIREYFDARGGLRGKVIAILGLSFKPDTDDMREAPSLTLIADLVESGAHIQVFDPVAMPNAQRSLAASTQITWCTDELDVASGAHALVLCTEWKQFRVLDFSTVIDKMDGRGFFDGRNQYDAKEMRRRGFDYHGIGVRPTLAEIKEEETAGSLR